MMDSFPNSPCNSKIPTQHTLQAIISPDGEGLSPDCKDVFELGAAELSMESKPRPIIPHWTILSAPGGIENITIEYGTR